MADLRSSSGDTPQPVKSKAKPQTLKCPACGGIITIKAVGITITAICTYCSSDIDVANENYQIIKKAHEKIRETLLELDIRGRLFGVEWEVIGYTERRDGNWSWDEYLLYNPYHGFRFLVENQGHWNFIKVLRKDIPGIDDANEIWLNGKKHQLFLKGKALVDYVKGEFYWRVKKGECPRVADYVAPPSMLSMEENDEEIIVSLGEYLKPEEVATAFKLKKMPQKKGVASNQPAPYQGAFLKLWIIAVAFIVLAIMVQKTAAKVADNAYVFSSQFKIDFADQDKTISTPSFVIPKKSNVLIQSSSPLDNDWLEFHLSLVNEQTNKEFAIVQAMEYYHGYDSDGAWSEGSPYSKTFISSVPIGNYRVLIDVDAGAFIKRLPANFSVSIQRDVPAGSNYWIIILMILLYPALVTVRRWSFENQRWSESDYAPGIYKTGNE